MQVFIKRFWRFDPVGWPVISFSQPGSLATLLKKSRPGVVIVHVGTQGPEVAEHERGKLLGFAEFGRNHVDSREALPPSTYAAAEKGPDGEIKWPHSVLMTRAWRFTDRPLPGLVDVLGHQLPMAAISNAVLLSEEDASRILSLPREEVDVATTQAIFGERAAIPRQSASAARWDPSRRRSPRP